MKREYLIGGIFFVLFLAFLIGITFMGGKTSEPPQTQIAIDAPPPTHPLPSPTIAPKQVLETPTLPSNAPSTIQSATEIEYWIAGYVTAEDGNPLPKSVVTISVEPEFKFTDPPIVQKKAVADEKGYYTIHLDGPVEGYIRSTPPEEYQSLGEEFSLTTEQPTLAKHFTHPAAPHYIQGKAIDALSRSPIAGAEITAMYIGRQKKKQPNGRKKRFPMKTVLLKSCDCRKVSTA